MILKTKFSEFISECTFREEPIIIRVNEFDDEAAAEFSELISKAHGTGQTVIPVVIDSYGGQTDSLRSMISDIESSQIPVSTVAVGKAMSCGAVLLSCGQPGLRFVDRHASVMIHQISVGRLQGKTDDIVSYAEDMKLSNEYLYTTMARKCGKKDRYFLKQMRDRNNVDWYLSPEEVLTHGLADEIGSPIMRRTVSVDYDYFIPPSKN